MKRLLKRLFSLFALIMIAALPLNAQMENPVKWMVSTTDQGNDIVEIKLTPGFAAGGWHIYDLGPYEDGPIATVIKVAESPAIEVVGDPYLDQNVERKMDDVFKMKIGLVGNGVSFCQKVKLLCGESSKITINVEWQACNDQNCIPPDDVDLVITLPAAVSPTVATAAPAPEQISAADTATEGTGKSLLSLILSAILWGFAMLLTPCVFPMVPMTVSFFLKKNSGDAGKNKGKRMALFFGIFIVALYTLPIAIIILLTYFAGGEAVTADIFNFLATHWIPNILFFAIFMIFAASFFGAFEITLPSSLVNKSDSKSDKGGLGGVFFLALTLVLVSFSCTGPIVGTVLIESTRGGVWAPIITMAAFSVAFALPFTIFAFAPSLLSKLPKSGGWLNSVKVVLGFIEIALGFKFLSVADQTYHWGLLDREVYLAIWIVVFTLLGLYLLGKINFKYDSPVKYISVLRLSLAIVVFSFVVYMVPGMWGAPLKALSGYLPPMNTQDFNLDRAQVSAYSPASGEGGGVEGHFGFTPKHSEFLVQPEGFYALFDYDEGLDYARKQGKPVFLDFTGGGCVNCREMEARVFSDPQVRKLMHDNFVIIQLYGDDKTILDESEWVVDGRGRTLKSLGKINTYLMNTRYSVNAQPYYVLLDPSDEHTIATRAYDLDVDGFVQFLKKAL